MGPFSKISNGQERLKVLDIFIQRYNDAVIKKHQFFIVPHTNFIVDICQVLYKEGIVLQYLFLENGSIKVYFCMTLFGLPFCKEIKKISSISKRFYFNKNNVTYLSFLKKYPHTIISTPKGLLSYNDALLFGEGGEVLFCCLV